MIDFTLTAEQKTLQKVAREFSKEILKPSSGRPMPSPIRSRASR